MHAFPWGDSRETKHTIGLGTHAGKPVHLHEPAPPYPAHGPCFVFSSRIGYRGPGARASLDVTRKSGGAAGQPFAPSWELLLPALRARDEATQLRELAGRTPPSYDPPLAEIDAQAIEREAWETYVPAFIAEMRANYRRQRPAWQALLARPMVVLLCYCTDADRCHRAVLRRDILPKLGAVDGGEIPWSSA